MKKLKILFIFLTFILFVFFSLRYIFFQVKPPKSKAADESPISLSFDPPSATVEQGKELILTAKIKANQNSALLRGYSIKTIFDKNKLQLKKIEYKLGNPSPDIGDTDQNSPTIIDKGEINIIGEIPNPTGLIINTNEIELVKLSFNVLSSNGTTIYTQNTFYTINSDSSLKENDLSSIKIDINGGGSIPTISPTGSTISSGNTNLKLKIKLQGINKKIDDKYNLLRIKGKIVCGSFVNEGVGDFKNDDKGIWSGTIAFNFFSPSQNNCILYLKGQKHLQKKICDPNPTEDKTGTYRCSDGKINISKGENIFDLSQITLLSGDLDQNGVVDSSDISLIRNNLGKRDADILNKADINLDGVVDTQDFSLILGALSIKVDEM